MITSLIGQYVVNGWGGDKQYWVIVAVTVDRDNMTIWAKDLNNRIQPFEAQHCEVVRYPCLQKKCDILARESMSCPAKTEEYHKAVLEAETRISD